jgi:predicted nucleic acid-binding Zn ribbon protein
MSKNKKNKGAQAYRIITVAMAVIIILAMVLSMFRF